MFTRFPFPPLPGLVGLIVGAVVVGLVFAAKAVGVG